MNKTEMLPDMTSPLVPAEPVQADTAQFTLPANAAQSSSRNNTDEAHMSEATHVAKAKGRNLEQIRDILFGAHLREQKQALGQLEHNLTHTHSELSQHVQQRLDNLEVFVRQELQVLGQELRNSTTQEAELRQRQLDLLKEQHIQSYNDLQTQLATLEQHMQHTQNTLSTALTHTEDTLRTELLTQQEQHATTWTTLKDTFEMQLSQQSQTLKTQLDTVKQGAQTDTSQVKQQLAEKMMQLEGTFTTALNTTTQEMHHDLRSSQQQLHQQWLTHLNTLSAESQAQYAALGQRLDHMMRDQNTRQVSRDSLAALLVDMALQVQQTPLEKTLLGEEGMGTGTSMSSTAEGM